MAASRGENELTDSSSSLDIFSAPIHSHHIPCIVLYTYLCTDCPNNYKREEGRREGAKSHDIFSDHRDNGKVGLSDNRSDNRGGGEQSSAPVCHLREGRAGRGLGGQSRRHKCSEVSMQKRPHRLSLTVPYWVSECGVSLSRMSMQQEVLGCPTKGT